MGHAKNGESHHEEKDVNFKWIMISAAGLLLTIVIGAIIAFASFVVMEKIEKKNAKPAPAMKGRRVIPPEPHLQTHEAEDLQKVREEYHKNLTTYGWVDQGKGIVRIPVERAMELVAQRGLPHKEQKQS